MATDIQLEQYKTMIKYCGYTGISLDGFSLRQLRNLKQICQLITNMPEFRYIDKNIGALEKLSLDEIRGLSKAFYEKYFNLHDIYSVSLDTMRSKSSEIQNSDSYEEAKAKVESELTVINPFDLEINLAEGNAMNGRVSEPLALIEGFESDPNRRIYFSEIKLGSQLNLLSASTLVHEMAHIQQDSNIGYAKDYNNKELISIFLEKVSALEADPTGELLKMSERCRLRDIMRIYTASSYFDNMLTGVDRIDNLAYLKSFLYAEKLFDMYLNERKQKNRDKYFYRIQDVFDGKMTVEDLVAQKNITVANSQDMGLLKRHI